jgi:hypothetical protein
VLISIFSEDYVYVTPSWAGPEDSWRIARIIEFLPAKADTPTGTRKDKGKSKDVSALTRVRLAFQYRAQDLSDRPSADSRVLLASIYSEPATAPQLHGKCLVAHREQIRDLAAWRRRPDRFYFTRAFDPYIKKEFDVVQASAVRNGTSAFLLRHDSQRARVGFEARIRQIPKWRGLTLPRFRSSRRCPRHPLRTLRFYPRREGNRAQPHG